MRCWNWYSKRCMEPLFFLSAKFAKRSTEQKTQDSNLRLYLEAQSPLGQRGSSLKQELRMKLSRSKVSTYKVNRPQSMGHIHSSMKILSIGFPSCSEWALQHVHLAVPILKLSQHLISLQHFDVYCMVLSLRSGCCRLGNYFHSLMGWKATKLSLFPAYWPFSFPRLAVTRKPHKSMSFVGVLHKTNLHPIVHYLFYPCLVEQQKTVL